jgi:hypothetical protein
LSWFRRSRRSTPARPDPLEEAEHQTLGLGRRSAGVEDIAEKQQVRPVALQPVAQVLQDGGQLGKPVDRLKTRPACQSLVWTMRITPAPPEGIAGRLRRRRHLALRVAQAGKGAEEIGVGISGWATIMLLGCKSVETQARHL